MNKREAAIITAHSGMFMGDFGEFHKYVEEIMGRPVFTHEMGVKEIAEEIKQLSKDDFIKLNESIED